MSNIDKRIRVMVVDDHEMVRSGLKHFLMAFPEMEMVAEAGSAAEALKKVGETSPDVVLMDLMMPGTSGVEAIRMVRERYPRTQVIALSSFCEQKLVQQAVEAGAIGYHTKDLGIDELASAVRAAMAGQPSMAPQALQFLLASSRQQGPVLGDDLTDREREVLVLIAGGLTNRQIAQRLQITAATAKTHVSHVLSKLGVASRVEAATLALELGLAPTATR